MRWITLLTLLVALISVSSSALAGYDIKHFRDILWASPNDREGKAGANNISWWRQVAQ
jgi:hypothetical protein